MNIKILFTVPVFTLISTPSLHADNRILANQETYVCTPTRMVLMQLDSNAKVTSKRELPLPSNVKSFNVKRSDNKLNQWYPPPGAPSGSKPSGNGAIFLSSGVEEGVAGAKYEKKTSESYTLESFVKQDDNTILAVSQSMDNKYPSILVTASACK